MSLFARVTSYPPLGQVTCVERIQKALKSEDDDKVSMSLSCTALSSIKRTMRCIMLLIAALLYCLFVSLYY